MLTWAMPCQGPQSLRPMGKRQHLPLVSVLIACAENIHNIPPTPHPYIYSLKTGLLQRLFLPRSAKPTPLIQFYTVNFILPPLFFCMQYAIPLPFCSALYKKCTEVPGCCGFSSQESRLPYLSYFCVFMCLSFLHSLDILVRSIPGAMQDVAQCFRKYVQILPPPRRLSLIPTSTKDWLDLGIYSEQQKGKGRN